MKRDASLESLEDPIRHGSKQARETNSSPSTVVSDTAADQSSHRYFVLDWLEEFTRKGVLKDTSVLEENKLLSLKKKEISSVDNELTDCKRKNSGAPTLNLSLTPPRHPSINPARPMPCTFRARSEAIGNGWNTRGVQKAKNENWVDALACWEKALDIRVQVLGDEHKDVANTLNNMGVALGRMERHDEAMEYLERVLKIRSKIYGKGHLEIASTLHNIANVFQQMDDYKGALKCFIAAKHIQTKLIGDKNIQVARTLSAIGHLHFECGQAFPEALQAYSEAREVFIRAGIDGDNEELKSTDLDIAEVKSLLLKDWSFNPNRRVHIVLKKGQRA